MDSTALQLRTRVLPFISNWILTPFASLMVILGGLILSLHPDMGIDIKAGIGGLGFAVGVLVAVFLIFRSTYAENIKRSTIEGLRNTAIACMVGYLITMIAYDTTVALHSSLAVGIGAACAVIFTGVLTYLIYRNTGVLNSKF